MFLLKKFISTFLMPFPIFLILLGMSYYLWSIHRPKMAKRTFLFALLWISLLSYPPFSALLLKPLESIYPKADSNQTGIQYVHVLGCAHTSNPALPLSSQISLVSLVRINEGVTIYNAHPNMKMIFSGYGGEDLISNARKNAQMAMALGVKKEDILILETPKDTEEEALAVKQIIHDQPLILVTSASHILRASLLFQKNGIHVIPAPTDFQVKKESTLWQFPSAEGLSQSEAVFHEYLGLLWGRLKGSL